MAANIEYGDPGIAGVKSLQYLGDDGGDGLGDFGIEVDAKSIAVGVIAGYALAKGTRIAMGIGAAAIIGYYLLGRPR